MLSKIITWGGPATMLLTAFVAGAANGTLQDVEHVVILMQENRSFDHYFGTLKGVHGFSDRTVRSLQGGRSSFYQPRGGSYLLPFHTGLQCLNDVEHDWEGGHAVWDGGKWDGWVTVNGVNAMAYHQREDLPYYFALADAYTICDAYFCSVLGPTFPNRLYLFTGTMDALGTGGGPYTDNSVPAAGFRWTTYAERLQAAGVTWRVYRPAGDWYGDALAWFAQFRSAGPGNPLYDRGLATVSDVVAAFRGDVTNGTLPKVSWVIPPFDSSEHPPYSAANGQDFTKQILDAVASSADVYRSTVFILTYDENGGFFDHLPPPVPPPGTTAEFVNGAPIGLGVRVPTIIVSPWTRGGKVCSAVFDHTSLLRFLERWTGVAEPNISDWRRQVCGDLTAAFDFAHPDFRLPHLPRATPVNCSFGANPPLPATQWMPGQEAGVRIARPLPYQPNATASLDAANHQLFLTMTNGGTTAVPFSVHTDPTSAIWPREYVVNPGQSASEVLIWILGGDSRYDLTCYGPNGFFRRFAGNFNGNGRQIEASSILSPESGSFTLVLSNFTENTVTFIVTNTYSPASLWSYIVAGGSSAAATFPVLTMNNGWYDLLVTTDADPAFVRRLAGHLETDFSTWTGTPPPPVATNLTNLVMVGSAGDYVLTYPPALATRTLEYSTNLVVGSWQPVNQTPNRDPASNVVITLELTLERAFYRLRP